MKYLLLLLVSFNAFAGFVVNTQTRGSVTNTSTRVLLPLAIRNYLIIVNDGSASMSVKFRDAHTSDEGIPIPAGGNYEPDEVPVDAVYLKAATGTTTYRILEGKR